MCIIHADMINMKGWIQLALMLFPDSSFEEKLALHKKLDFKKR